MAFGSGPWYRRRALARAGLQPGMRVLDIGTGTGLTAREAAHLVGPAGEVIGVDPSAGMMEQAKVPAGVRLLRGTAEADSFAGVVGGFHLHGIRAAARGGPVVGVAGVRARLGARRQGVPAGDHGTREQAVACGSAGSTCAASCLDGALHGRSSRHAGADALLLGYHRDLRTLPASFSRPCARPDWFNVYRHVDLGIFSDVLRHASRFSGAARPSARRAASSGSRIRKPKNRRRCIQVRSRLSRQ